MTNKIDLLQLRDELSINLNSNGKTTVFDPLRKKHYIALPEEIVRQLCIAYLIKVMRYPESRILVEKQLEIGDQKRRFDLVVLDWELHPFLLIECKSYKVSISESTISQLSLYNYQLNSPYVWLTNGPENFVANTDFRSKSFSWLEELPRYPNR